MDRVNFHSNRFESNLVSNEEAVVTVRGAQFVKFESDVYLNNGESH